MHSTTFRALKVTSNVATQGAESAVYDCLVLIRSRCPENVVSSISGIRQQSATYSKCDIRVNVKECEWP